MSVFDVWLGFAAGCLFGAGVAIGGAALISGGITLQAVNLFVGWLRVAAGRW